MRANYEWLWAKASAWMLAWQQCKRNFESSVAFAPDALHVLGGVLVALAAALVMRKPVTSWRPWLVVFVLTCMNELVDVLLGHRGLEPGIAESAKDLLLTMFLPTLLLVVARWHPRLLVAGR